MSLAHESSPHDRSAGSAPALPARGLYAITAPMAGGPDALAAAVAAAIEGGARIVQYRDKSADADRRLLEAGALRETCHARAIPFLVNDDVALAAATGADGVHVGLDDASVREAREALGPGAIVGATCHASLERAREAVRAGADYVAFGSFFASPTKPRATPAPVELLEVARSELEVPIAAIGGIDATRGKRLLGAGASYLAVVSGVFGARDVRGAARSYACLFENTKPAAGGWDHGAQGLMEGRTSRPPGVDRR